MCVIVVVAMGWCVFPQTHASGMHIDQSIKKESGDGMVVRDHQFYFLWAGLVCVVAAWGEL